MQLTMEPLDEMLASARALDRAGLDTIWLAEAYPWWRKHGMEARSSTVVSALMAQETERLTIGWGIISPFTRHPVQVAMDARVVQELAGPERFILGFGTSKIFLNNAKMQTNKTLGPMRDAVAIVRGVLSGERFEYDGETWSADVPAQDADAPRGAPPVYVAATAPKMQALAGEIADGCLTPSITTPAFVRYTRENVQADIDIGCTIVASIAEDRDEGRDGAREIAGMYLANKVQNIKGAADTLLDLAGLEQDEIRPVAEAMERGGRQIASRRSRNTATPAAHTSCWSCGARSGTSRFGCSPRKCCRSSDEDRRAPSGGPSAAARLDAVLHRLGAGRGRAGARRARGLGACGSVAAGRGRACERPRHLGWNGRGADTDVQRAPRYVVLGPRAVAGRDPRIPAGGLRARRADLRARAHEYEGRGRVLRHGGTRAARNRRATARRRADRGGRGRDREDAARRRAGRRVPRLRGRLALPRNARRRRRRVHPRRADGEQARARAFRDALAAAVDARAVRPHGILFGADGRELDRQDASGARRRARVVAAVGSRDVVRRRTRRRECRLDRRWLRLARVADTAPHRSVRRPARAAGRADGRRAAEGTRVRAVARRRRGRGLRNGTGR